MVRTFLALLLCSLPLLLGGAAAIVHRRMTAPARVSPDAQIVCPHCQVRGQVTTRRVRHKKGISGGKAAGAILTAGVSLPATGLSRKETATAAVCGNCGSRWDF